MFIHFILRVIVVATLILPLSVKAEFIEKDKTAHVVAGALFYGTCVVIGKFTEVNWLDDKTCLLVTLGASVAKEVYDSTQSNHEADFNDITATMVFPVTTFIIYRW